MKSFDIWMKSLHMKTPMWDTQTFKFMGRLKLEMSDLLVQTCIFLCI